MIPKATPARLKVMFSIPLNQNIFTSRKVSFRLSPYFYVRSSDGIPFVIKSNTLNTTSSVQGTIDRQAVQDANAASGQLITNNTVTVKNNCTNIITVLRPPTLVKNNPGIIYNR